ncbi:hypothetical protein [Streptomyces acidiscabies]|uniref:hypothetical protein n=1 Tax=Streptomyces acidiscabies TaxID=42234 RepID=UPI001180A46B|nr:hypothetical protein [Streptomyces acidiscabies]
MRKRSIAVVGAAAVVMTMWGGTAAQAHEQSWGWRACGPTLLQNCGTAYVSSNHRTLTVCDEEADGLGFWTAYQRSDGRSGTVKDTNGSASGCGKGTAPSGVTITKVRLVQNLGGGTTVYLGDWRAVS